MKHIMALSLSGLLTSTSIAIAQDYTLATAQSVEAGNYVVYFPLDKSTLDPDAQSVIAAAALEFQRTGSARISVRGHTDTSGSSSYNQSLSERREQAVINELVHLGISAAAVTGEALGESDPAVPTGDGVPEAGNRRVAITIEQPLPPTAEAPPTPALTPAPAQPPTPAKKEMAKWNFSVGPYYGYNLKDEAGKTSHLAGLNFAADVPIARWLSAGVEQAGFYHFDTLNEGFGGRSVASLDLTFGDDSFRSHIGGNIGYIYGSGIDDDFVGGPEIGFTAGRFTAKLAYDVPFNRSSGEGIINTTMGFSF